MVMELIIRFVLGGLIVCAFAVIGAGFGPKSFGGIFGAAPSVALATLGLTFITKGPKVVGLEGRSMIAGAIALAAYSLVAMYFLRRKCNPMITTSGSGLAWFAVAFGLWGVFLA